MIKIGTEYEDDLGGSHLVATIDSPDWERLAKDFLKDFPQPNTECYLDAQLIVEAKDGGSVPLQIFPFNLDKLSSDLREIRMAVALYKKPVLQLRIRIFENYTSEDEYIGDFIGREWEVCIENHLQSEVPLEKPQKRLTKQTQQTPIPFPK